jgi:hypothetical protein
MEATIERQATAAFTDGCFAAVWPELIMPTEARQMLSRHLALEALRQGPDRPLRLVVAGSWHEPREEGGWSNFARILGRTGEVLCSYAKFAAFHDEAWGEEAIQRGAELPEEPPMGTVEHGHGRCCRPTPRMPARRRNAVRRSRRVIPSPAPTLRSRCASMPASCLSRCISSMLRLPLQPL